MKTIQSSEFYTLNKDKIVILFTSENCEYCPEFKKQVEENIKQNLPEVEFIEVETDKELAIKNSITTFPALAVFLNGIEYYTHVGLFSGNEEEYKKIIETIKKYYF